MGVHVQYLCTVISKKGDTFWAKIVNTVAPELGDAQGEFYITNVPQLDRYLIVPGAGFYWDIFEDRSEITFIRGPMLTEEMIKQARKEAQAMLIAFERAGRTDKV